MKLKLLLEALGRRLDCVAHANVGNFGEFTRHLHRLDPPAPDACQSVAAGDPRFRRWLARWNGAWIGVEPCALPGRADGNV